MEVVFISQHVRENSGLGQTCLIPGGVTIGSKSAGPRTHRFCMLSVQESLPDHCCLPE